MKKHIIKILALTFMVFMGSCAQESIESPVVASDSKMQIRLQLPGGNEITRVTEVGSTEENLIKNVHLFMFDASGNKEFDIYMNLPYSGTSPDVDMSLWNSDKVIIVLNANILASLNTARNIHVVANVAPGKLASVADEASLKAALSDVITTEIAQPDASHPLLMHGVCSGHDFTATVRAPVTLVRNVSKLRLTVNTTNASNITFAPGNEISVTAVDVADRSYIVSGTGTNPPSTNYIDLAKAVMLSSSSGATKKFIAPARYMNENLDPASPTCLVIQVPFHNGTEMLGGNYYKIKINEPDNQLVRRNTIYDITVNIDALGGETPQTAPEISATVQVLPWNEKTLISDLTQTYLSVNVTELQVAGGTTNFYYATNAEVDKRSVTSSQPSWLTATLDSQNNNNLKITASGTGYTVPRSATFSIKVNDLTKVITVKQEASPVTDNSISLTPQTLYLSSAHPARNVALVSTGSWSNLMNDANVATYTPASGTGNATLSFTRKNTTTGSNATFRFLNQASLMYADVRVCNLTLTSSVTELNIPGEGVTNGKEIGIVALGGDAQWVVKSKPAWMTASYNNGDLLYSATAEPSEQDRSGTIVLAHINDADLTVTIQVKQSAKYIKFPEYDYMVISVQWNKNIVSGLILDTQIDLSDTGVSGLDRKPVGYGVAMSQAYRGYTFLDWAGDNTSNGYMSYLVNMYNLCYTPIYDELPRYFNINVFSTWYNSTQNQVDNIYRHINASVVIKLYKGGTMSKTPQFDYVNSGGTLVYDEVTSGFTVTTHDGYGTYSTSCTLLGTIKYDKFKNTADFSAISLYTGTTPMTRSVSGLSVDNSLNGITREEYRVRMNKRR